VHGPVTQGAFLQRLGIEARAVSLMAKSSPEVSENVATALKRLTEGGRGGMGSMFKAIGISDSRLTELAGLSDQERRGGIRAP
jgi:SAM-dependent MidA family methyltransferase